MPDKVSTLKLILLELFKKQNNFIKLGKCLRQVLKSEWVRVDTNNSKECDSLIYLLRA